ncbi:MAG: DNA translocase FtsK [Candidatus Hydrogenedentes bacterium]|nr:DNA translocase FtsK [Candidatus Hydrogenedentota bacterium]
MHFLDKMESERRFEILGVVILMVTTLLFLSLVTDGSQGQPNRNIDGLSEYPNLLGGAGATLAGLLAFFVGDAAHVLYLLTGIWGIMLLRHQPVDRLLTRFVGSLILIGAVAGLLHVNFRDATGGMPGGAFGAFVAERILLPQFRPVGANVVGLSVALIGVLLATEFLFIHLILGIHRMALHMLRACLFVAQSVNGLAQIKRPALPAPVDAARRSAVAPESEADLGPYIHLPSPIVPGAEDEPLAEPAAEAHQEELAFEAPAEDDAEEAPFADPILPDGLEHEAPLEPLPTKAQLDFVAPEFSAVTAGSTRKKLKRKRLTIPDELPPDYQYPKHYSKPPMDILEVPKHRIIKNLDEHLRSTSRLLEETLKTFNIEARVTDVTRGPTITRFELEPAPGIKVSQFLALADDIALALKAHRVRVEAPIPGKGRVGIEVPNQTRDPVLIRELLESEIFSRDKGALTLALGKDIAGDVQVANLATMPHLLVAGATGAGKTVCVKALLASLLFVKTPAELQLMLIDPKMVELSIFNDIPHLITPVVTDPKKASASLNWLINEMEERYRLFAHLRVRNIEVYNESVENGEIEVEDGEEGGESNSMDVIRKLPYIVCIIDELADLMMLARAEVEGSIARLAQLARAVGIHLIIATQRPSVDVLTGVIKANFPARVSFQVSSRVDSRCILDEIGAERLIGMGDLLYLPAGQSKPTRIQGAFVSDDEMNSMVAYLKSQAPPQYRDEIQNWGKQSDALEGLEDESDPLFDEAVRVVLETGQASISMVQRRLRVGYTRAARLIDMMELKGIVGPHTGSKAREILVDAPLQNEVQ